MLESSKVLKKGIVHSMILTSLAFLTSILSYTCAPTIFSAENSMSDSNFNVQIGSYGEISSLKITGDTYPTDYVMNAANSPKQNTSDHEWLGELMFEYKVGSGLWTKASTNQSGDVRSISQTGNTTTVSYKNSSNTQGIKNFELTEVYSLANGCFNWQIKLKNTGGQNIEFGDVGLPLPFNERWPGEESIYETRVVTHDNVANSNSYVYATRPSGVGPFLLMTPDTSTGAGFEYKDHWRTQEHPDSMWCQDQGDWPKGLDVYYIHSNRIKSTGRGYFPSTSLILTPGQEKVYAFKFSKVADMNAMKEKLYTEGLIDVNVVPSMIVPSNQTAKFDLHTSKDITSVSAQYPSETSISYVNTVNTDHKIYQLTMKHLGQNNITVNYGNGEKTVLQFYAIESVDAALQRHATFMVQKTQWDSPGNINDKAFDDWMMDTKSKRGIFDGYWGWGDDWGYTHGEFLAEKNVLTPVASEINALDQYLETTIWTNLMNGHHSDYLIHDFLMPETNDTPTYRGYAYAHIYNTYFSMYKIAKLYPNIIKFTNAKNTYLLRCYNILKALYSDKVAYNWNTGLMGELTTPEIIKALKDEGYTSEANNIESIMLTKYNNFKDATYPYGSEYSYDNTGEEAVYTLAKLNNNTTMLRKINEKTRACRGTAPIWYYYSVPTTICGDNWWQFQYSDSLAGYCMDDWMVNYSTTPELDERMNYAAKLGCIANINSGQIDSDPENIGAISWTYQAEKGNLGAQGVGDGELHNGWRQMSGEADLGLFGAIKTLSADVVKDPIFGLYGYGCDVTKGSSSLTVIPKDGILKRLNMVSQKLYMSLEKDEYSSATIGNANNYIEFTLKNTSSSAHTTKVSIKGLTAGSYNIFVNNVKTNSISAVAGQVSDINLPVGTDAAYNIKIQGSDYPNPDAIVYGDANSDGVVDNKDCSELKNYILGKPTSNWDNTKLKSSDLNSDGKVNSVDYSILKRYLLGTIKVLPYATNKPNTPQDGEVSYVWNYGNVPVAAKQVWNDNPSLTAININPYGTPSLTIPYGYILLSEGPNGTSQVSKDTQISILKRINEDLKWETENLGIQMPPWSTGKTGTKYIDYWFTNTGLPSDPGATGDQAWEDSYPYVESDSNGMSDANRFNITHEFNHALINSYGTVLGNSVSWIQESLNDYMILRLAEWRSGAKAGQSQQFAFPLGIGYLDAEVYNQPFVPIESCGINSSGEATGPSDYYNDSKGFRYNDLFPLFVSQRVGMTFYSKVFEEAKTSEQNLQTMTRLLDKERVQSMVTEYAARLALGDFKEFSSSIQELASPSMYAATTNQNGWLVPSDKSKLPRYTGRNNIPISVNPGATEVTVDFSPDAQGSNGTAADMRAQIVYRATDGTTVFSTPVSNGKATIKLNKAPKNGVVTVVISNVTMSGYKKVESYGWDPTEVFGYKIQVTGGTAAATDRLYF